MHSVIGLQLCLQALERFNVRDLVLEHGSIMAFAPNNNEITAEFFRFIVGQETDLASLQFPSVKMQLQEISKLYLCSTDKTISN